MFICSYCRFPQRIFESRYLEGKITSPVRAPYEHHLPDTYTLSNSPQAQQVSWKLMVAVTWQRDYFHLWLCRISATAKVVYRHSCAILRGLVGKLKPKQLSPVSNGTSVSPRRSSDGNGNGNAQHKKRTQDETVC